MTSYLFDDVSKAALRPDQLHELSEIVLVSRG
jgi:hypothetical protein